MISSRKFCWAYFFKLHGSFVERISSWSFLSSCLEQSFLLFYVWNQVFSACVMCYWSVLSVFLLTQVFFAHIPWTCSWYCFVAIDRGGTPHLVSTVPLRTGTAVHVLFCFLPSRRFFVACCLCQRTRTCQENELLLLIMWQHHPSSSA